MKYLTVLDIIGNRKTFIGSAKNNVQVACARLIKLTFPYN